VWYGPAGGTAHVGARFTPGSIPPRSACRCRSATVRPPNTSGAAKSAGGTPSSATRMKSCQICAGSVPPATARTPCTPTMGMLPSGCPTHTAAERAGVYPTNQAFP